MTNYNKEYKIGNKKVIVDKFGLTEKEFLSQYNPEDYDKPSISVDMLVFTIDNNELKLLLAKRESHPFINCWTLPGGFVRLNETTEDAAKRRLKEEVGLENIYLEQLFTSSEVDRDPRMRVISTSYIALTDKKNLNPIAGDDTLDIAWFTVSRNVKSTNKDGTIHSELTVSNKELDVSIKVEVINVPKRNGVITTYETEINQISDTRLAFDHAKIINIAVDRLRNKIEYTHIAFNLVEEYFSLPELQKVYEIILGKKLYKTNFRRKIAPMVIETDNFIETSRRHAKLYKFNSKYNIQN